MAHLIETMAYNGEKPWHGLGVAVKDNLTPKQMMEAAGLDWTIEKRKIQVVGGKIFPDRFALTRSSDNVPLALCSERYIPIQNEQAFDFFKKFTKAGKMKMHTAGSLDGGKCIWALAKIEKGTFDVVKGDEVEAFLLMCQPHTPGRKMTTMFTPTRVVCNNTLSYAMSEIGIANSSGVFTMRHSREFNEDVYEEAEKSLGIFDKQMEMFQEKAKFLAKKKAKDEDVTQFFADLFQPELDTRNSDDYNRIVSTLEIAYNHQPGLEYAPGTWWQALNAVTYYVDHLSGASRDEATRQNNRLRNAWFGSLAGKKRQAMSLAVNYAQGKA